MLRNNEKESVFWACGAAAGREAGRWLRHALFAAAAVTMALPSTVAFAAEETGNAEPEPAPSPQADLLPIDPSLNQYLIDNSVTTIIMVDQAGVTRTFDFTGHTLAISGATSLNTSTNGRCTVAGVGASLPCHKTDNLPKWRKNNYHFGGMERGPAGCNCQ
jgi:hypothetical protein